MMSKIACFVACLLAVMSPAAGYSGGAPIDVCDDMTPKHPAEPQGGAMPYEIGISKSSVRAGETVQISIGGNDFKGFLLQVRDGKEPVGKFAVPSNDKYVKTINCGRNQQNAATHKNAEVKNKLTINWESPASLKGKEVTVYVTVAQNGATYWVRRPAGTIKLS